MCIKTFLDSRGIYKKGTLMPVSKTYLYPEQLNRAAAILQALGHGARLNIINYLMENGNANNKELTTQLGLSQSTVSGHLKILKDADVIVTTQIETSVYYQINPLFTENSQIQNEDDDCRLSKQPPFMSIYFSIRC